MHWQNKTLGTYVFFRQPITRVVLRPMATVFADSP